MLLLFSYSLESNAVKNFTNTKIEYADIIKGQQGDILIVRLKKLSKESIINCTLTPVAEVKCKIREENEEAAEVICFGRLVGQNDETWEGTLVLYLTNNRVEAHTLTLKVRGVGCFGCPVRYILTYIVLTLHP